MSYLQPYKIGSLIRTIIIIYFRNLPTLLAIYVIPLAPVEVLKVYLTAGVFERFVLTGNFEVIFLIGIAVEVMAILLVTFPTSVAISEICLGIKPNAIRAYQRAFAHPGRLIGAYLLAALIIIAGIIALFVPGIIFSLWYFLVGPVVVIEGLGGREALRRSRELGRGFYLRNLGILTVVNLLVIVVNLLVAIVMSVLGGLVGFAPGYVLSLIISSAIALVTGPIIVGLPVLFYYDMRARKEGYGAAQLAEDMK